MYLTNKLAKVGITATRIPEVIEQALKIGSGEALQTAIDCALTGISWGADQEELSLEDKKELFKLFLANERVREASRKLKAIMHEAE